MEHKTHPKDIHDHRLAFSRTGCHKASENKSTIVHSELIGPSTKVISDLPNRKPRGIRGEDSAIHMAPYMGGRAPSMACRICGDYSVVGMLAGISGCTNDPKNKEVRRGVGI